MRAGTRVSCTIPKTPRQEVVSMSCTILRSGGERHQDSLIPEDQNIVIVDFSSRFEVPGHLIAIAGRNEGKEREGKSRI